MGRINSRGGGNVGGRQHGDSRRRAVASAALQQRAAFDTGRASRTQTHAKPHHLAKGWPRAYNVNPQAYFADVRIHIKTH